MTQVQIVRGRQAGAFALIAALAVAGCSSTGTTTPSQIAAAIVNASPPPIQAPAPSASPGPSSAPASEEASGTPEPTAVVTDIDPCQLITSDDAKTFVGVKFGRKGDHDREQRQDALFGSGPNIFTVEVAVAPDVATARRPRPRRRRISRRRARSRPSSAAELADDTDAAILWGSASSNGISSAPALVAPQGHDVSCRSDAHGARAGGGQDPWPRRGGGRLPDEAVQSGRARRTAPRAAAPREPANGDRRYVQGRRRDGERDGAHAEPREADRAALLLRGQAFAAPARASWPTRLARGDLEQDLGHGGVPDEPNDRQLHREAAKEDREAARHPAFRKAVPAGSHSRNLAAVFLRNGNQSASRGIA